jgi:dsRNA-specific ribonuclease
MHVRAGGEGGGKGANHSRFEFLGDEVFEVLLADVLCELKILGRVVF